MGVTALVDDVPVYAGSIELLKRYGIGDLPGADEGTGTFVHVAVGGKYAGRIILSDRIKDDSAGAVGDLRGMGISVMMFTGDSEETASAV